MLKSRGLLETVGTDGRAETKSHMGMWGSGREAISENAAGEEFAWECKVKKTLKKYE